MAYEVRPSAHLRLIASMCAVDTETWLANLELSWDHRDPADRTIVATAVVNDCPLVTSDRAMRDFYPCAVWWLSGYPWSLDCL